MRPFGTSGAFGDGLRAAAPGDPLGSIRSSTSGLPVDSPAIFEVGLRPLVFFGEGFRAPATANFCVPPTFDKLSSQLRDLLPWLLKVDVRAGAFSEPGMPNESMLKSDER